MSVATTNPCGGLSGRALRITAKQPLSGLNSQVTWQWRFRILLKLLLPINWQVVGNQAAAVRVDYFSWFFITASTSSSSPSSGPFLLAGETVPMAAQRPRSSRLKVANCCARVSAFLTRSSVSCGRLRFASTAARSAVLQELRALAALMLIRVLNLAERAKPGFGEVEMRMLEVCPESSILQIRSQSRRGGCQLPIVNPRERNINAVKVTRGGTLQGLAPTHPQGFASWSTTHRADKTDQWIEESS